MAEVLVAGSPVAVLGARVLDVGAGTGAGSRAAGRAGAVRIVGVDLATSMLRVGTGWHGVVAGDASALPFARASFDLVVAACCLGHVPDPATALGEVRRVGAALVAGEFDPAWTHPAKVIADEVAAGYGFVVPAWYARLKGGPLAAGGPERLAQVAHGAGFTRVDLSTHRVDFGLHTPQAMARWRLGMAHLAPFVASLPPSRRAQLRLDCERALGDVPPPVVSLVVLAAS